MERIKSYTLIVTYRRGTQTKIDFASIPAAYAYVREMNREFILRVRLNTNTERTRLLYEQGWSEERFQQNIRSHK